MLFRSMKINVIGCGYLGTVHAACLATLGHEVVGVDTDVTKVRRLSRGEAGFFELGLLELLAQELGSGRLSFATEPTPAEVYFLTVGTPQVVDGLAADVSFVHAAIDSILPAASLDAVVVGKSTVPVGTAAELINKLDGRALV